MAEEKATVGGAVRYAFALLAGRWRSIWGALALNALACTVCDAGQIRANLALTDGGLAAMALTTVMVYGAVYRSAFADRHARDADFVPAAVGVGWRRMEWRLLGATLLAGLFTVFMLFLASLVLMAVGAGMLSALHISPKAALTIDQIKAALGPKGLAVAEIGVALLICLGLFISIRLSLTAPATADQGAVRVLRTWQLTRGQFWTIFSALMIVALPISVITGWIAVAILGAGGEGASASAEQILAASLIDGVPAGFLITPLSVGVLAYFYRAASGPAPPRSAPTA